MVTQVASIQTDGQNVIAEYDGAGGFQRYYVHGTSYVDEHILMNEQATPQGKEYYYLLGALYSVVGLAEENGDVVQRYSYDAYGLPTQVAGDFDGDRGVALADLIGRPVPRVQGHEFAIEGVALNGACASSSHRLTRPRSPYRCERGLRPISAHWNFLVPRRTHRVPIALNGTRITHDSRQHRLGWNPKGTSSPHRWRVRPTRAPGLCRRTCRILAPIGSSGNM